MSKIEEPTQILVLKLSELHTRDISAEPNHELIGLIKELIKDRIFINLGEKKQYWFFMSGEWSKCSSKEAIDIIEYLYANYLKNSNTDEKISINLLEEWQSNKLTICDKIFNDLAHENHTNLPPKCPKLPTDGIRKYGRKLLCDIDVKIKDFLDDTVDITTNINDTIINKELYEHYKSWAQRHHEEPYKITIFGKALKGLGIVSKSMNIGKKLLYIKLK